MTDYSMDFDAGAGEQGPWLRWHAAPTRDGAHGPGTWSVKDAAGSTTVNLTNGAVFDWPGSVTGWMQTSGTPGVAPQKRWNASRARFSASRARTGSAPCALPSPTRPRREQCGNRPPPRPGSASPI